MKKILKDSKKTRAYIDSLPKLYVVGCWAKYGVREYPNSGKTDAEGIPLVWDYYDGNGTCSEYHLVSIYDTTSGSVWCWNDSEDVCEWISDALNTRENGTLHYMGNYGLTEYNANEGKIKGYVFGHKNIVFEAKSCGGVVNAFHKAVDEADGDLSMSPIGNVVKRIKDVQR